MMNRLEDYVKFIHGFQVYRPSYVDSDRGYLYPDGPTVYIITLGVSRGIHNIAHIM
jgi:hypothetical protein